MTTKRLVYLFIVAASLSYAQTITLTSADSRCGGSPLTCTFVAPEGMPNDYGIALIATVSGGGTWAIGAENQTSCNAVLFNWYRVTSPPVSPAVITSISASGTIYIAPNGGTAGACAPGTYVHTIMLTNGGSTYTFTAIQRVIYRLAAPVFFNGCGVADASLSGAAQGNCAGGMTQATPAGNTFTYDLNKVPCSDCRPGGTFNMPSPGGSFRDQLGNLHTVITPSCFVAPADAEKSELSVNNLWIVAQSLGCAAPYNTGNWFLFPSAGATTPSYSFTGFQDCCNGDWAWSNTTDTDLYFFVSPAFGSGSNTLFKHTVLGTAPAYTTTTEYTMPYATFGRAFSTNFSHQDMNKLNWYAMNTYWDFSGQVSTSGTALTWVSGQVFDTTKFLDQFITTPGGTAQISSCSDNHTCTLYSSLGTQTNVAATMQVPWQLCAFNPVLITAQGAGYTPTCGDLTAMARPHISATFGAAAYISHDVVGGLLYIVLGTAPYDVIGSFNPSSPTAVTLSHAWVQDAPVSGYQFGTVCTPALSGNSGVLGLNAIGYCEGEAHASGFSTGDGNQWFLNGNEGAAFTTFRMDSSGSTMVPYSYNGGTGNFLSTLWTQYEGGEYSGSRKSPYILASTGNVVFPTSWNVTNCTNANPMVITVNASFDTGINGTTHNKVLIGGVQGNTACNGSQVVAGVSGINHEIWTLSAAGNGAYTPSTGDATEDAVNAGTAAGDADQMFLLRELGQELRRFGHTRSVAYNDRVTSGYYANTRGSLSMDASRIIYTTDNGTPSNLMVVSVATGVDSGIGMTTNMFDQTHSVTSVDVTAGTASLHYSTPDTGDAIIEIGQTLRFVDVPGTGSSTDSTFQRVTDTSGANPRTTTFSGLTAGVPYYYRIIANHKWMAWGSFTVAAVSASGGTVIQNAVVTNAVIH